MSRFAKLSICVGLAIVTLATATLWSGAARSACSVDVVRDAAVTVAKSRDSNLAVADALARVDDSADAAPRGIALPDGSWVPPLNGVRAGDGIPALHRSRDLPPIGAVVRLWKDAEGVDWWVTETGAAFTTRWATAVDAQGREYRFVRLDQVEPLADAKQVRGQRGS